MMQKTAVLMVLISLLTGVYSAMGQTDDAESTTTPVPKVLRTEFDQPILFGTGWSYIEQMGNVTFQWTTAPRATLHVQLVPDRAYVIRFKVLSGITDEILDSLAFRVNDVTIAIRWTPDNGGRIYEAVVPGMVIKQSPLDTTLTFITRETARPVDLGLNADTRSLGIMLDWLTVEVWSPDGQPEATPKPATSRVYRESQQVMSLRLQPS